MKFTRSLSIKAVLCAASMATLLSSQTSQAVDVNKANNTNALNLPGSWVGGVVPTGSEVALWDSTVLGANTTVLGDNLAFQGIRVADPGGAAIINATGGFILSLGSAGIDMSAATQNFALRSNVALTSNQNWTVASGRTLEIGDTGSSITGSHSVNLSGTGVLSFRNSGMFTDAATNLVLSGGINLVSTNARILTSQVTFAGATNFGESAVARQTISLQGNTVVNAGTHNVTLRDTVETDIALAFNGTGYSVTGPGNLRFLNGNASGVIRVNIGNTVDTASIAADMTIGNNVRMVFGASNQFTTASDITVESGGFLTLNANAGASSVYNQTIGSLQGAGTVERNGGNASIVTLTIDGGLATGTTTFSGVVQDGGVSGRIAITKAGANTQVFSGANTYTGQTQINGGTLLINGTHVDAGLVSTGQGYGSSTDGHFRVAASARLGGSGRIEGNNSQSNSNMVLVQSGGTLAPGASIGTLVLDGANISGTNARVLNMAAGAEFVFELAGNGGTPERVDFWNYVDGDFLLNDNAINLSLSGPVVAGNYTVDIIRFFSDNGTTEIASGIGSGLVLGTTDPNISGASIIYGTDVISINFTTIPEPTTFLLLAAGGLATMVLRRRRA